MKVKIGIVYKDRLCRYCSMYWSVGIIAVPIFYQLIHNLLVRAMTKDGTWQSSSWILWLSLIQGEVIWARTPALSIRSSSEEDPKEAPAVADDEAATPLLLPLLSNMSKMGRPPHQEKMERKFTILHSFCFSMCMHTRRRNNQARKELCDIFGALTPFLACLTFQHHRVMTQFCIRRMQI